MDYIQHFLLNYKYSMWYIYVTIMIDPYSQPYIQHFLLNYKYSMWYIYVTIMIDPYSAGI